MNLNKYNNILNIDTKYNLKLNFFYIFFYLNL